jgi:hypothetical protein
MDYFSHSVRNFAVSGTVEWSVSYLPKLSGMVNSQSGNRKMTATPNTTVTRPSKRKRYYHPLKPCEPETVSKAYARSPLQTPERLPKISEGNQFVCRLCETAGDTHKDTEASLTAHLAGTSM